MKPKPFSYLAWLFALFLTEKANELHKQLMDYLVSVGSDVLTLYK